MVRLVFRPYTQVWRTICTLVSLPPSTRVSPGFGVLKRSSPSFGSYQACSCSSPSSESLGWPQLLPYGMAACTRFLFAIWVFPPYHSHAWYTPWSVFPDGPVGDVATEPPAGITLGPANPVYAWKLNCMCSRSSPRFTPARYRGPLCLLSSKKRQQSVTAYSECPCGCINTPRRPACTAQHREQVTTLQPLPTQRFQVF